MSTDTVTATPETTTAPVPDSPIAPPIVPSVPGLSYDRCTATLGHNLSAGDPHAYVNDTQTVHGDNPLAETPPGAALRVSNPYYLSGLAGATCEIQWHGTKEVWELIRVAHCPCEVTPPGPVAFINDPTFRFLAGRPTWWTGTRNSSSGQ